MLLLLGASVWNAGALAQSAPEPGTAADRAAAEALWGTAREHYSRFTYEDNTRAIELLREALQYDSSFAPAHYHLSFALGQAVDRYGDSRTHLDSALAASERAIALAPDSLGGYQSLSIILNFKGMMERAREIDAMLLERRPSDPWLLMALGWTNWYRRTLEARPAFSNAHAELAYVALAQGLDEVARRHLEDHRAAEVDEPRYYNRIGGVALFLGEDDLARDYYLQSLATSRDIRNRPRGRYTQTALGYLSWKAGDLDAARDLLAESERMSCVLLAGGADG